MVRTQSQDPDRYPVPSDEDLARVKALLREVGGPDITWSSHNTFEVLAGEHRLKMERLASDRLARATWVLAVATVVLALATVALIFATVAN